MANSSDWKAAGESALTTALVQAEKLAGECGDIKQLDALIKTLGEIVGTGLVLGRKTGTPTETRDDDDD